jgi:hypothetical protein
LGDPIIVFQMGKVGSRSIFISIRALRMWRPLYHSHLLNDLDELEARAMGTLPDPAMELNEIERGRRLRRKVDGSRRRTWNVISLVRDPVARNISSFFEYLTDIIPDAYERLDRGELTQSELVDAFFQHHLHDRPLVWFQTQLEPVFGIDVFSTAFEKSRGYTIYEQPRVRLLVLRLEDLQAGAEPAMKEFLGIPRFELLTTNLASKHRYAESHRRFLRDVKMPDHYLSRMYDSEFSRHFYTERELAAFRRQWGVQDSVSRARTT